MTSLGHVVLSRPGKRSYTLGLTLTRCTLAMLVMAGCVGMGLTLGYWVFVGVSHVAGIG